MVTHGKSLEEQALRDRRHAACLARAILDVRNHGTSVNACLHVGLLEKGDDGLLITDDGARFLARVTLWLLTQVPAPPRPRRVRQKETAPPPPDNGLG